MTKQIINIATIVVLATGIIFSCKKKEEATPDTSSTTTTSTTGGTTGSTTGGTTTGGSTTNTLTLNTWSKGATTYTTSTAKIFGLSFTSKNQYYYSCVDNNNNMNSIEVFLYNNNGALPVTGTYSVIDGLANQSATLTPNQAFINIPGSGGGASSGTAGTLSVTNTNSIITIVGTGIPFKLLPSGTTNVSLNIQK